MYYLTVQSEWISRNKQQAGISDFYTSRYEVHKMYDLFDWVNQHYLKDEPIDYLEFGVFKGDSMKWWIKNRHFPTDRFFGFDTFTGLPEDFGMIKKGGYSAENNFPDITDERCRFIQGLYQQSLHPFLATYRTGQKKLIHIDCDLYSSTLFVLTSLAPHLKPDDIIIFDEFITPTQEFKAFHDFMTAYYLDFKLIGGLNNFHQTAVILQPVSKN